MARKILNGNLINTAKTIFVMLAVLVAFAETVSAQPIKLTLQDAPLIVLKDSSVTKKINGVPGVAGTIRLKIKWHVLSFIPNTFNKLKIELLHGSKVLSAKECYSQHSDKTPKCSFATVIDETEASASGDYKLRITNNNRDDINGFNILKEITDINPAVANIESTFERDCNVRNLIGFGGIAVSTGTTVEKGFMAANPAGEIHIKAKWHGFSLNPNFSSFHPLKVEVLFNGSVVQSDEGYSIHSNEKGKTNKINIRFKVAANNTGVWKLRISNFSGSDITGFDIEKGQDLNPMVPGFRSTFNPCS